MSRKEAYRAFFTQLKKEYNAKFPQSAITATASGVNYMRIGSPNYPPNAAYHVGFTRDKLFRVEVTFSNDADKATFDSLIRWRGQIERELGETLDWARLDGAIGRAHRKRSQVSVFYPGSATADDLEYLDADFIDWAIPMAEKFVRVMNGYLKADRIAR
ncbi:MAG: DUF4268 domain-containing protein [Thermomicrobiales bacterium]